nr:hypothetical protein [Candidatus Baldrarchaeota archaeon]
SLSWLFGENSSVKAYRWDPSTASYQEVQFFLKVGEGYWLYTPSPISTTFYAKVVDSLTLELKPGWNLIVSIYYNAEVKCLEGEVYSGAFTWTGSDYCEVKVLKPGRGYWILAYRPSVVQLVPR